MIKVIRLKRAAAVCIASVLMIACAVAVGSAHGFGRIYQMGGFYTHHVGAASGA